MNRIQTDGAPVARKKSFSVPFTDLTPLAPISCGALGKHLHISALLADGEDNAGREGMVSLQEADHALCRLMGAGATGSAGVEYPAIRDVLEMNPIMLSMMMTQLVLSVSGNNARALCRQLEHATEIQTELRNKQVAEYQEQINKVIEQASHASNAALISSLFDWIISGAEVVIGALKIAESLLTADPLALADGCAYFSAGIAGMIKAGAETALALGADKSVCNGIIGAAGMAQNCCEDVALLLDVIQIGRAILSARAVTKAAGEVLESGVGKALINVVANGTETELKVLAQKAGQEVSKVMSEEFVTVLESTVADAGGAATGAVTEAAVYEAEIESEIIRGTSKSFTRNGVAELTKTAIEDALKELMKKGGEVTEEKLRDAILNKLRTGICSAVYKDYYLAHKMLMDTRCYAEALNRISAAVSGVVTAKLEKEIERLGVQQDYIDFVLEQTENNKKVQQKQLNETYQNGVNALRIASEIMDSSCTVLADIAGKLA